MQPYLIDEATGRTLKAVDAALAAGHDRLGLVVPAEQCDAAIDCLLVLRQLAGDPWNKSAEPRGIVTLRERVRSVNMHAAETIKPADFQGMQWPVVVSPRVEHLALSAEAIGALATITERNWQLAVTHSDAPSAIGPVEPAMVWPQPREQTEADADASRRHDKRV